MRCALFRMNALPRGLDLSKLDEGLLGTPGQCLVACELTLHENPLFHRQHALGCEVPGLVACHAVEVLRV